LHALLACSAGEPQGCLVHDSKKLCRKAEFNAKCVSNYDKANGPDLATRGTSLVELLHPLC